MSASGQLRGRLRAVSRGRRQATRTITSDITSGYAAMLYSTNNQFMSDNLVDDNDISDCDGFGIYMQLAYATARSNGTRGNRLRDVCKTGIQFTGLPFAGIGWTGGSDCLMEGDRIDGVGSASTPAPGVRYFSGALSSTCTGRALGVTVTNATRSGFEPGASGWQHIGCESTDNTLNGFLVVPTSGTSDLRGLQFIGCKGNNNALTGIAADAVTFPTAKVEAWVEGGEYANNGQRGIFFRDTIGGGIGGGVSVRDNGGTSFPQVQLAGACSKLKLGDFTMSHATTNALGLSVASTTVDLTLGAFDAVGPFAAAQVANLGSLTVKIAGSSALTPHYSVVGAPAFAAPLGSTAHNRSGGAGTSLYVKESDPTGTGGWVAK